MGQHRPRNRQYLSENQPGNKEGAEGCILAHRVV